MSSNSSQMPSDLMEALMKDPVKRAMILQLLTQEKSGFDAYKRREQRKSAGTPVKKVQRLHCESPTALQRRRALAQLNQETTSASSSSELSDVAVEVKGPKLPFDELLKGVRAYVEVRRNNVERSDGIKAVMKLMGATIKDQFTNDVTHVVFKDGSFPTYQKAKLLKVHLVSVLWLDAVRRNNARVPEKNYPAFGSRVPEEEVSMLCSQLQKDYEEVIKDEKRRSMAVLPEFSRKSAEKNRRRTMMTPQTSKSSYFTAQKSSLLFSGEEESRSKPNSPDLTSDDSDCGMINGQVSKRPRDQVDLIEVTPDLTDDMSKNTSVVESGGSESMISRLATINKRQTIHVTTDMVITPNLTRQSRQKSDSMGNTNKVLQNVSIESSVMSSLRVSSTSSDRTKSGLDKLIEMSKTRNSGCTNKDNSLTTIGTTMSSLRLSDSLDKNEEKPVKKKTKKGRSSSKENSPEYDKFVTKRSRGRSVSVTKSASGDNSAEKEKSVANTRSRRSVSLLRSGAEETNSDNLPSKRNNGRSLSVLPTKTDIVNAPLPPKSGNQSDKENTKKVATSRSKSISKTSKSTNKNKRLSSPLFESQTESSNKTEEVISSSRSELEIGTKSSKKASNKKLTSSTSSSQTVSGLEDDNEANCEDQMQIAVESKSRRASTRSSRSESEERSNKKNKSTKSENVRNTRSSSVASSRSESAVRRVNSRKSVAARRSPTPPATTPSPAKRSRVQDDTIRKRRPLFNPDDFVALPRLQDEEERMEYLKQKAKKTPEGVFVNPNNVLITPLPSRKKTKEPNLDESMEPINWSSDEGKEKEEESKRQKQKRKKDKTPPPRDSSADEQRDLLELLTKKCGKNVQSRLCLTEKKSKHTLSSISQTESASSLPITPIKRRSTLDFQTVSQTQQKRKLRLDPKRVSSIVCTKMHRYEVFEFENIVRDLGMFFVEDHVSDRTTHLVAGESKRTINMLKAIARGCWVLKPEWLQKSKEAGKWLDEEDYEDTDFSPAVQQCRLQRQAFGPTYSMDIFKDCGWIYVAKATSPKSEDLRDLITICQGKVTCIYRNADIVVGDCIRNKDVTCVTELWVLDSITLNKLKPVKNYLIKKPVGVDSPHY